MNPFFIIFESGAIAGFLATLYYERRNKQEIEVLLLAFVYGMILEALNIHMSKEVYVYSADFFLEVCGVPLAIGAGWAIVYYLAKGAAQRFGLSWWQTPFVMAIFALVYDLSLDAIAIRLGFWKWIIPLNEEWFGVPYDNFFGWLAVVWTFGLFVNLSYQDFVRPRLARLIRYTAPVSSALLLGMQIMIYQNLAAVLSGKYSWGETMRLYAVQDYSYAYVPYVRTTRIYLFFFLVAVLLAVCWHWIYGKRASWRDSRDKFRILLSSSAHLTFIFFLFVSGIYKVSWILPLVSFGAFVASLYLEFGHYGKRVD